MLRSFSRNAIYRILCTLLWFLVLVGLPLTSFPLLNRLTGAIVAPFSAIPLAVLILIWVLPYVIGEGKLPREWVPLLYFILVVVAVSALGFFLNGFYLKGRDFFDQTLRAFITLAIGLCFYLVFSAYPQDEQGLRQTLIFLYTGGVLLMLWALLEVVLLRQVGRVIAMPAWTLKLRYFLAVQSPNVYYTNRVTGFAYEPSWFVRQFNLIFFPLWLSASFQRKSLLNFRLWWFQLEDVLLIPAFIVFYFSAPRVGLLAFLMILGYLGLLIFKGAQERLVQWYLNRRRTPIRRAIWVRVVLGLIMAVVLFGMAVGLLAGFVRLASRWDDRYILFFKGTLFEDVSLFPITEAGLLTLGRRLAFYERLIYWFSGWRIFNDYPFGVGLGNAGFYFIDRMHGIAYNSLEMRDIVFRAGSLPNTKNIWVRLLAETGFIGFVVYVVWLIVLWRSAGLLWKHSSKVIKILGLAGRLCLAAYVVEGFSMDSFAMPYIWVMAGLISAGAAWVRKQHTFRDKAEQLAMGSAQD
jgi:hypothetical protein